MKKRAVIVGAGIAGLSAASFLVRTGCDITLLEARNHFGGRIHTVLAGRQPIELGAEFLHGESQAIRNTIQAAGLSTHTVEDKYQLFEQGRLTRVDFLSKMDRIINRVNIRRPDCSFQDFLDSLNLDPSDDEQAIGFIQGYHAARPHLISAHSLRRGEYAAEHMPGTQQARIDQGYGALVGFLEQDIRAHGGKLTANAVVEKVRWQAGHVEIAFLHGDRETIKADAAIITLPLGVLKSGLVQFQPPLNVKKEAIEQLHFGNVVKVVFQFRKQWWPDFGFIIAVNEAFPTWWTDPRGPILTAWAGGPKADALLEHSPTRLEKIGLEFLARLFPKQAKAIPTQFMSAYTYDWFHDPYLGGAYSYIPVNGLDLPKLLAAPMADTLYFAGEATATDAQTGTVCSAFETGLRAARELVKEHIIADEPMHLA